MKFGLKVALVSDAGTPTVSDPGYGFVKAAIKEGISIEALPGPSAVLVAVAGSALCPNGFTFEGYLNKTESIRKEQLRLFKSHLHPVVIFENPKRVI
jgi:16S rRNA (cytidine1402-2'-O)-methyltransferase